MRKLAMTCAAAAMLLVGGIGQAMAGAIYIDLGVYGGKDYKVGVQQGVGTAGVTWDAAKAQAASDGYQLASVGSAGLNDWLFSKIQGNSSYYGGKNGLAGQLGPWLGGSSQGNTTFSWLDGSQFSFSTWGPSQPDNAEGGPATNGILYYNGTTEGSSAGSTWGDYGNNFDLGSTPAFIVTPVPEPSSFALLGLGGLGLAVGTYRRRRAAAV